MEADIVGGEDARHMERTKAVVAHEVFDKDSERLTLKKTKPRTAKLLVSRKPGSGFLSIKVGKRCLTSICPCDFLLRVTVEHVVKATTIHSKTSEWRSGSRMMAVCNVDSPEIESHVR